MEKVLRLTEDEANEIATLMINAVDYPLDMVKREPSSKFVEEEKFRLKIDATVIEKILRIYPDVKNDPAFSTSTYKKLKDFATIRDIEKVRRPEPIPEELFLEFKMKTTEELVEMWRARIINSRVEDDLRKIVNNIKQTPETSNSRAEILAQFMQALIEFRNQLRKISMTPQ